MTHKVLKDVEQEVTELLSSLIKINTTNPPGNETAAANFIAKSLQKEGIETEVVESNAGRGSAIARLKGTGEKPNLLLLSHLDVVAADPKEWTLDPFAGTVKDGYVYGRGAYDMKGMTAMQIMVMKLLKRNRIQLKGDLVLAGTADEEQGGEEGAGWLLKTQKEKIWCPYVINEGAGLAFPCNKNYVFPVQTAEKGILWMRVKAKGTPGHGSMPNTADNAILRMNKVVDKLGNYKAQTIYVDTLRAFLAEMGKQDEELKPTFAQLLANPDQSEQILNDLVKKDQALAEEIRPRTKMTIAPTMIQGGIKENIIPSACEAVFDCRILPGQSVHEAVNLIKSLLADVGLDKLSFEFIQAHDGSESTMNTELWGTIGDVLREFYPGCGVSPTLTTGGTDSRFFREMGSVCYGFQPMIPDEPNDQLEKRMHGIDERITVENLVFGTSVLYEVAKRFMT